MALKSDFTNHNVNIPFKGFDRISAVRFNPYSLQNHAQSAVPSQHDIITNSITNAPELQRVSANPSAISIKNIVRGLFNPFPGRRVR